MTWASRADDDAETGATTTATTRETREETKKRERKPAGEALGALWREIKYKPLGEDDSLEAVALLAALELARRGPDPERRGRRKRGDARESESVDPERGGGVLEREE